MIMHSKDTKEYDYVIFSNLFPPDGGGVERAAEALANFLTEQGKQVLVVCSGEKDSLHEINGVDCKRLWNIKLFGGFYPLVGIRMANFILRLLRRNPDSKLIIYGRHFTESLLASFISVLLSRDYIYIDTGFESNVFRSEILNAFIKIVDKALFSKVMKYADKVVFVSETSKEHAISTNGRWLESSNVILNGFPESIIKQNPFRKKEKKVIFASRLVNIKNPQMVLEAYQRLSTVYPDWKFYFIGDGDFTISKEIRESLPDNVVCIEQLMPQKEFHALLSESAIYINASFCEGLPLSIIEAAALGCKLVLSDIEHNLEIAKPTKQDIFSFSPYKLDEFVSSLTAAIDSGVKVSDHKEIQKLTERELCKYTGL